ncbi:MAG: acetate--CoA ligase family protein [Candidatus Aenigmatarchaeota archaeon]
MKIDEEKAFALLKKYSIPVPRQIFTLDIKRAIDFAKDVGFPVYIKLCSPEIIHKTEAGAVKRIENIHMLEKEFKKMKDTRFKKKSILIQERIEGVELLAGAKLDPQFGHVLIFGLGGIWVEILHDISMRIVPINRADARQMIEETKCSRLLKGFRGIPATRIDKVEQCLLNLSRLLENNPDIKEMDINPLFANRKGVWAADVRIIA